MIKSPKLFPHQHSSISKSNKTGRSSLDEASKHKKRNKKHEAVILAHSSRTPNHKSYEYIKFGNKLSN